MALGDREHIRPGTADDVVVGAHGIGEEEHLRELGALQGSRAHEHDEQGHEASHDGVISFFQASKVLPVSADR